MSQIKVATHKKSNDYEQVLVEIIGSKLSSMMIIIIRRRRSRSRRRRRRRRRRTTTTTKTTITIRQRQFLK